MLTRRLLWLATLLASWQAAPVAAQSLLSLTVEVTDTTGCEGDCVPTTGTASYGGVEAMIDAVSARGLNSINGDYSTSSQASITANFRGVTAFVEYEAGSPVVTFTVPGVGITEVFDSAASRGGNEQALERYLRANTGNLLGQILQETVASTPTDPIAGNPASLMSRMAASDYAIATTQDPGTTQVASTSDGYDRSQALIGLNPRIGRYNTGNSEVEVTDLPLSYVLPLADPRYAINFDLPLTYIKTDGLETFAGSFGLGLRLPVLDNWTVTPALRLGIAGSEDLGALQGLWTASVTSNYRFEIDEFRFGIGNSIAYARTIPMTYDGTKIDYDQSNIILRNGIGVSGNIDATLLGQPLTWEVSVVNTHFLGDEVFVGNYTDLAFSIGTVSSINGFTWDSMRVGLTYTFSDTDYNGLRLNFGYQF